MPMPLSPSDAAKQYGVNVPEGMEVIYQPLYDFQAYAAAGATQYTFFQTPIGQSSKTLVDTNMQSAGQLPAPQKFLVQTIEVYLIHNDDPVTYATGDGHTANDVYNVLKTGSLEFTIGSKPYAQVGPLLRMPPANRYAAEFAISDQTADTESEAMYMSAAGPVFNLASHRVPLWIPSNQNFDVKITFSAAVAITTGARIGVVLGGLLYRSRQ